MKMTIPRADVAKAGVQKVRVGEVKLGPVKVGRLTLSDVALQAQSGAIVLKKPAVQLTLKFMLNWRVGLVIDVPWPFDDIDFSARGRMDLGSATLGIVLDNLVLPGLANLSLTMTSVPVTDVSVVIGALKDLDLGAVVAERIQAQGLVAPDGGLQLAGASLASLDARGLALPDAAVAGVTVGRLAGGSVPLDGLKVQGLALPKMTLADTGMAVRDLTARPVVTKLPEADVGLLAAALEVTTTATLQVEELRIEGVKASARIGEIALGAVELPWEVLGLTLSQLGIETIQLPQVEVH